MIYNKVAIFNLNQEAKGLYELHIGNNMSWSSNLRNVNDSYRYLHITTTSPLHHCNITTYKHYVCDKGVRVNIQCCMFT